MIKPAGTESSGLRNNVPSEPADPSSSTLPAAKPSYPVAGVFSDPAPIPFKNKKAATPNLVAKSQAADPFWDKPRTVAAKGRSEERRVGKECRCRGLAGSETRDAPCTV